MGAKEGLDLNDVGVLVRVVQAQSFSAVARERGVPVSTVSRRVARLEAALGVRLLERTTRRLRLTDAGRVYFGHAERAVDDLVQGSARVRALQTEPRGRVRIQAPELGNTVLNQVYGYLAKNPGVSVDLELVNPRVASPPDGYDIVIMVGKVTDTADFIARTIWRSSRKLLYASPSYLMGRRALRRVEDLARHDCIATRTTEGLETWTLHRKRQPQRITFAPRLSVNRSSAAQQAVVAGLGIAILPEVLVTEDVARNRLVRVLPRYEVEAGGVHLLYRAHRSLTAAVRTCVEHLLAEMPAADPSR